MEIGKKIFTELPAVQDHAETHAAEQSRMSSEGIAGISDSLEIAAPANQPAWTDQNASDPGIVIEELFGYLGEQLSYQQDAVNDGSQSRDTASPYIFEADSILPKDDDSE